jgi:2-polyprenyl-6-methoxyphenol hydroxylase-like FAD-dependent oxidoreductase
MEHDVDLLVAGAGSGGLATALAAARAGLDVLLVEAHSRIGGTAAWAGVNTWASGVGGTALPREIYDRLKPIPQAVGITSVGRHGSWPGPDGQSLFPGGENLIDPTRCYDDTLRRHGSKGLARDEAFVREHWHNVVFEPDVYARTVATMLAETGRCAILRSLRVEAAEVAEGRIRRVRLSTGQAVGARFVADCTGSMDLAASAGCEMMTGQEPRSRFNEPSAPETSSDECNGATLIYRVSPKQADGIEPVPPGIPVNCWWAERFPVSAVEQYPCGDLNFNMLPTLTGREAGELGPSAALAEARRRVFAHWHDLQKRFAEFRRYGLAWIAPLLGVREGRRVVGRRVLTEQDIRAGLSRQPPHELIAIADHALDTHGVSNGRGGCKELAEPYGIPYACLLAADVQNLLIPCRGGSFSSIAASSVRISRTLMQLGQAAGTAAAMARDIGCDLAEVPPQALRARLCRLGANLGD